jgi:hypothetical protein
MGLFDLLKPKPKDSSLFSGGTGETAENAVVINATSSLQGIPAEYAYVEQHCGKEDEDWTLDAQMQTSQNGREYDVLTVTLKQGGTRTFWFDITSFYGKF